MKVEDELCPEVESKRIIKYSGWIDGIIKWVDNKRGFGFVEIDYQGEVKDAFVHVSLMDNNKPLPDGYPVKVVVVDSDDGLKVIAITSRLGEFTNE